MFDRLVYIDRLKRAGVEEPLARAHADALREALIETVATKADLGATETKLQQVMADLDRRITALDHKIDIVARDLTIRGAAGLIIIASLLVGLKIFG